MADIRRGRKRAIYEYDPAPHQHLNFQHIGARQYLIEFDPPRSCCLDVVKYNKYRPVKKYKGNRVTHNIQLYAVSGLDNMIFITGYHHGDRFNMIECYKGIERG